MKNPPASTPAKQGIFGPLKSLWRRLNAPMPDDEFWDKPYKGTGKDGEKPPREGQ
jgi:hypothetical protein